MQVLQDLIAPAPKRPPWNKGKLIGAKPPLWPKHVWSIRTKLQIEGRALDLALFNLAIDSKLRACDVVALRVEDVAPNGYAIARATVPRGNYIPENQIQFAAASSNLIGSLIKLEGLRG